MACLISVGVFSQNLVENSELNIGEKCFLGSTKIDKAENWSNANGGSVDIFSSNHKKNSTGIPENFMGNQASVRNYAGFVAYFGDERVDMISTLLNGEITAEGGYQNYGEYLQGEIKKALVAGETYKFSYKVSLAEGSSRAVNGLGVYFSKDQLSVKNNKALGFTPQIKSSKLISDKDGWSTISGTFTAKGGEKFFAIGAYAGSFMVESLVEPMKENDTRRAYYYINGATLGPANGYFANFDDILNNQHVIFLTLNFETGKSDINSSSHDELNACAEFLKANPDVNVQVDGHTDKSGSYEINNPLSKSRAAEVKNYLVGTGIDASRISTDGYGSTRPIYTENENDGRNRRIELYQNN